jgi:hypothetical protein
MAILVSVEASPKKVFATAMDWPGWSRSGKTEELALEALATYGPRYAVVAREAGIAFQPPAAGEFEVVERVDGGGGTAFGVPSVVTELDRRPVSKDEAQRLAGLVEAAWAVFDRVVAGALAELRKGPRGGGRDRDKIVGHVVESDGYYARELGLRIPVPDPMDGDAVHVQRASMLEVLAQPSDGSHLAGRSWTLRYAARRIAWHAIDHAWEIEDRSDPVAG